LAVRAQATVNFSIRTTTSSNAKPSGCIRRDDVSSTIKLPRGAAERRTRPSAPEPPSSRRRGFFSRPAAGGTSAIITSAPVLGWITARVAIFGALALSRFLVNELGAADPAGRPPSGLIGWDAVWYVRIVDSGYSYLPWEAMRFFPLVPIAGAVLRPIFGARGAVLFTVNLAALAAGFVVARLARQERRDEESAARAGWLLALLPPAFVFAMGYAEAVFVLCAALTFLALRRERFGWAIVAAALCGLSRPLGVLIVLPAIVEALRGWSRVHDTRERAARLGSIVAAPLGTLSYLVWSWIEYGDFMRPLTVQQALDRRGGFENPLTRLTEAGRQLAGGTDIGSGLHLPWALAFLFLLVVLFRRWPVSYGLFAGAILLAALSAENLDSLERYGLSAFPFVLALADILRPPWAERVALALCGAGLVTYATLAFLGAYVP
jgi:hypothetical protein